LLTWEYTKNRYGIIHKYNHTIDKNEIPFNFRNYYLDFVKKEIKNYPNKAQKNALIMKYYVWKFIEENKIINLYDLFSKYTLFEKHLNHCHSPVTKKLLTHGRKREVRSAIHSFANFCYKKDKKFAPHKKEFYKNYRNDEKSIVIYDKNKKRYFIDLKDIHINYYTLYKKYINFRHSQGYSELNIYGEHKATKHFWEFINTHRNKDKIADYTINDILEWIHYIKTLPNSKDTTKLLSLRMQNYIYTSISNFIKFIYSGNSEYEKVLLLIEKFSISRKNNYNSTSIPNNVLEEIINKAKYLENNLKLKVFILISAYFGLRMSEILNLKIDCIRLNEIDNKKYDFYFYSKKSDKYRIIHKISKFVAENINLLIAETKQLREEANSDFIFLTKHTTTSRVGEITIVSSNWLNKELKKFIIDNNILTEDGKIPYLTSKIFRTTLPQFYENKGISLQTTQQILGHKNISTTDKYYNKTNEYEYEVSMQKAIDNITCMTLPDKYNDKYSFEYQNKKFYNTIEEGYCSSQEFNNSTKICKYLEARGNCYGCTNMVTTPEYLPFFKKQIEIWTEQLKKIEYLGSHVSRHLEWKIGVVKEIILRLEIINNV
jgi:integrase